MMMITTWQVVAAVTPVAMEAANHAVVVANPSTNPAAMAPVDPVMVVANPTTNPTTNPAATAKVVAVAHALNTADARL